MIKKAVILLSGGLDSTTCLAMASSQGYECYALSCFYGQKHHAELQAAKKNAGRYGAKKHEIIELPIGGLGGSALTDSQIMVPNYESSQDIPVTYVPARNTIMLSIALAYAEVMNCNTIFIGVSAVDYSNYPDCRPEYIKAFEAMANLATKKAIEDSKITIETPLIHLSKRETIALGLSLGVDYAETISCYRANDDGLACGLCASCYLRKKGFEEGGFVDTTRYHLDC